MNEPEIVIRIPLRIVQALRDVLISVPEPSAIVIARAPDVGVDSATVLKQ